MIQPEEVGCGHGTFPAQEGYEIVWYTDSGWTDRVDAPITMDGNKTVYGKYEKKALTYTTYAYFELADPAELGGVTYSYITEADLDRPAVAEAVEALGPVLEEDGTATVTFRYGGEAVMVKKMIPAETFIQVEMDLGDAAYSLDGLHYDEANSKNLVKGYCQTESATLRAYFARNVYPLTVDMNWPAALELSGSVETVQYRNGQRVALTDPELDGYAFTGWTWPKGGTAWTGDAPDPAGAEFVMPKAAVKAVATWDAASFRQTITHYFQNVDGLYDAAALAAMEAESGTPVSVHYGAETYEGMRYSNGGVSLEKDGETWYFAGAAERDGAYWTDSGALKADWSGADRQAATAAASVQVTADAHYAAVLCPTEVDEPWLNVSGREQLVFGYGDAPGNAVTVSAEFAQGSSSYVKAYQWRQWQEDVLDVGTVGYQICQDGGEPADYSGATPVGTYRIKLDLTNVAVRSGNGNYVRVVQDPDMTHQTLTVTPRPVALGLTEYDGASPIVKEYDGTRTVTAGGEEIGRHYQFTAVTGKDESGVTQGDADGLGLSFRVLYDSQNAADCPPASALSNPT